MSGVKKRFRAVVMGIYMGMRNHNRNPVRSYKLARLTDDVGSVEVYDDEELRFIAHVIRKPALLDIELPPPHELSGDDMREIRAIHGVLTGKVPLEI